MGLFRGSKNPDLTRTWEAENCFEFYNNLVYTEF